MTRALLTYFNSSVDGEGLEGLINWSNVSSGNLLIPIFLLVFYSLAIYVSTKNEYKIGGQVLFLSFVFFILSMIVQTFTEINQIVIFLFAVGMLVGTVLSAIETSN
jgi:uncharacterized membrane protein YfhO